jgi:hypothetical protein
MSVATITAPANGATKEQVERVSHGKYTVDGAGRIVPKGRAIAYDPRAGAAPSPAAADAKAGLKPPGKPELIPGENSVPVVGAISEGATEVGEAIGGLINEGGSAAGKAVAEGLVEVVKPIATKLTLYAVLIFGAVAMLIFGASEMLKPVGGPDLAGKVKAKVKR